jgi:3-oxoacyl-[acyl-carrier-protein] synthase II
MHAMGDKEIDKIETLAVKQALGDYAYGVSTSATKSMIGHTQGACGAIEAIATILSINKDTILPTINLDYPDPECDLDYTPRHSKPKRIKYALVNTMGFGGKNASVVIGKI